MILGKLKIKKLSESEINCLVELAVEGEIKFSDFCKLMVKREVFKSNQAVRNFITHCTTIMHDEEPIVNKSGRFISLNISDLLTDDKHVVNYYIGCNE